MRARGTDHTSGRGFVAHLSARDVRRPETHGCDAVLAQRAVAEPVLEVFNHSATSGSEPKWDRTQADPSVI